MAVKNPPHTHREMAKILFKNYASTDYKIIFIPIWLKIEAYTLFFTVLPKLITLAVWVVIVISVLWAVTLI